MLICEGVCGRGVLRQYNQDNLYLNGLWRRDVADTKTYYASQTVREGLFAVCDGMGGESYGEEASLMAVSALNGVTAEAFSRHGNEYLRAMNHDICRLMRDRQTRIGTTFAGLWISGGMAGISNIGDSRIYLLREKKLRKLSCDHTQTQRLLDMGLITPQQMDTHPDRHKLTQHLGIFPEEMVIEPYTLPPFKVEDLDLFLLCSDGLTDMLTEQEIARVLMERKPTKEKAAHLYEAASERGGRDNITVLLVQNIG